MSVFLLLTNKIQIQTKSRSPLENPEIQSKIRNPRKNPVDFEISYAKYVWRTALEVPKLRCALFGGNISPFYKLEHWPYSTDGVLHPQQHTA